MDLYQVSRKFSLEREELLASSIVFGCQNQWTLEDIPTLQQCFLAQLPQFTVLEHIQGADRCVVRLTWKNWYFSLNFECYSESIWLEADDEQSTAALKIIFNISAKEKVLVSACFLGKKVRYDGASKTLANCYLEKWQHEDRVVTLCPEVSGGLSIPRSPAEINQANGKVITNDGHDVSKEFSEGANQALHVCQQYNIRYALLKESSPSCGSSTIYDGTFSNHKIQGQGITSALLIQNGIKVFSEDNIEELAKLLE